MSEESSEAQAFKSVDAYYAIARGLRDRKEYKRALLYLSLVILILLEILNKICAYRHFDKTANICLPIY